MSRVLAAAALAVFAGSCSRSHGSDDGPVSVLASPALHAPTRMALGNDSGGDDDPSLIRAQDGLFYLVFISDRSGNIDLWITSSGDGVAWSAPVQITTSSDEDLYPNLIQSADGAFHLVWHRFEALGTGQSHLYYRTTTTPLSWGSTETPITTGVVDDWDCKMVPVGAMELRVYFSSAARSSNPTYNRDIYVVRSTDRGQTWGSPVLSNVSHVSQFDRYPAVLQLGPTQFQMIFQRHDTDNFLDSTSDLFVATSADGLAWNAPVQITSDMADAQPDLFANFYLAPIYGQWITSWTSTSFSTGGIVNLPVGGASPIDLTPILGMGGWSTRVAPASGSLSLLVFVSSVSGTAQLYSVILPL
jgi:hypothetical protein